MDRILITGGRGGLGVSLTETLASSSRNCIITLGRSEVPSSSRVAENVIHKRGSILNGDFLSALLEEERITHLIHTAGVRTSECASDPQAGFEANVVGADRVFEAAAKCPTVEKLVHFSTAAVYGRHPNTPTESSEPAPPSPYAITKATSEISALGHTQGASYSTLVLRPGFVVGPHSQGTLPSWLRDALAGRETAISFPERFFLHWAPDVSLAVSELLALKSLEKWEVVHPPGIPVTLTELRTAIEEFGVKAGITTRMEISPILETPFPTNLAQQKFQRLVPDFPVTPLSQMIDQMAPDKQGSTA